MGYFDDLCVKADTKPACIYSLSTSIKLFDSLGFTVHPEKSLFSTINSIISRISS